MTIPNFRLRLVAIVTRQALKNGFYWSHANHKIYRGCRFWAGKTAMPPHYILQHPGKAAVLTALPLWRPCKLREKSQGHLLCFSIPRYICTIHYSSRFKNWISLTAIVYYRQYKKLIRPRLWSIVFHSQQNADFSKEFDVGQIVF